ncbi:S1 family peptidase [Amycolatopsis sp. NPDC004772]
MAEVRADYVDALERSVLQVLAGTYRGTAFVIGPRLALTCLHVVEKVLRRTRPDGGWPDDDPGDLEVVDHLGRRIPAWIRCSWPEKPGTTSAGLQPWPDLAVLELGAAGDDLPAVLMDAAVPAQSSTLVLAGYPAGDVVSYQVRRVKAGYSSNRDQEEHRYLALTSEAVDHGFSGGPLLNGCGLVVGYARLKRGRGSDAPGGFAILISDVLGVAGEVRGAFDAPGPNAQGWVRLLGIHLKEHGRDPQGKRYEPFGPPAGSIDIELLGGDASVPPQTGWMLRMVAEPLQGYPRAVADLGEEVLDAVDQWSRRHYLSSPPHVELVGRVLHRLLLPKEVYELLQEKISKGANLPILRLRVQSRNPLARIPWEFAAEKTAGGERLRVAADPRLTFARYVDVPPSDPPPVPDEFRVLVVVNVLGGRSESVADAIKQGLTEVGLEVTDQRIKIVHDKKLSDLVDVLAEGPWHLIHYVGTQHGVDALTFRGYFGQQPSGVQLQVLSKVLEQSGCRVLVLQLQDRPTPAIPADADWLCLLGNSIQALVLAEHATSMEHVVSLSVWLCNALSRGETVERAVQLYRAQIADQPPRQLDEEERVDGPLLDVAAFGSVSVTTTQDGEVRLAKPAPRWTSGHATVNSATRQGGLSGSQAHAESSSEDTMAASPSRFGVT